MLTSSCSPCAAPPALSDTTVYRVSKSLQGATTYIVYEEYKSSAAMKHHCEQEEFKAFFAKAGELIELIHPRW